tara:strand:+ start:676 stop:912 length:237 start_codon:yes stop_codon:yes gene_type:complete
MNTLDFNTTINSTTSILINNERVGTIATNDGSKIATDRFEYVSTMTLDDKEITLYGSTVSDMTMKVRKFLLDYEVYEA